MFNLLNNNGALLNVFGLYALGIFGSSPTDESDHVGHLFWGVLHMAGRVLPRYIGFHGTHLGRCELQQRWRHLAKVIEPGIASLFGDFHRRESSTRFRL